MLERLKKAYPEIDFKFIGRDIILWWKIEWTFCIINTKFLIISTNSMSVQFFNEDLLIEQILSFRDIDLNYWRIMKIEE